MAQTGQGTDQGEGVAIQPGHQQDRHRHCRHQADQSHLVADLRPGRPGDPGKAEDQEGDSQREADEGLQQLFPAQ